MSAQVGRRAVAALVGEDGPCRARRRTASRGSSTAPSARGRSARQGPRRTGTARVPRGEALGRGPLVARVDADEGDLLAALGRELLEDRELGAAGPAPRAHLLITTGWPRSRAGAPRTRPCRPRAARWTARAARPAARARRRGPAWRRRDRSSRCPPGPHPCPGCVRPMTTTATRATAASSIKALFIAVQGAIPATSSGSGCFNGRTRGRQIPRGRSRSDTQLDVKPARVSTGRSQSTAAAVLFPNVSPFLG